jgi:maltose O-acetyltransferase
MINILFQLYYKFRLRNFRKKGVKIGNNTFIAHTVHIDKQKEAKVEIGNNCFITRNVMILSHVDTHVGGPLGIWKNLGLRRLKGDVIIGDNVFVGVQSVIMPGIKIGNNSVIGALSLVNNDVPANTVVGGTPAKKICSTQEMLLKSNPDINTEELNRHFS